MYYESMNDYLIDNRNGIIQECKKCGMSKEQIEVTLNGYDFAALQALRNNKSYQFVKNVIIEMFGEEKWVEIEKETLNYFGEIREAEQSYIASIKFKKKVGYSAAEINS